MSHPKPTIHPDQATQRLEHFLDTVLRKDLRKVLSERDTYYSLASQCVQLRQLLADLVDLGKVRTVTINVAADGVAESDEANALANAGERRAVASAGLKEYDEEGNLIDNGGGDATAKLKAKVKAMMGSSSGDDPVAAAVAARLLEQEDEAEQSKRTVLHKSVTVCDAEVPDPTPLQLLCDVSGNNYFEVDAPEEEDPPQPSASSSSSSSKPSSAVVGRPNADANNSKYHFFMTADVANPALIHINVGCGVIVPMTHEEAVLFLKEKEQLYRAASQRLSRESLRVRFRIRLVMEAITRMQDAAMGVPPSSGGAQSSAR